MAAEGQRRWRGLRLQQCPPPRKPRALGPSLYPPSSFPSTFYWPALGRAWGELGRGHLSPALLQLVVKEEEEGVEARAGGPTEAGACGSEESRDFVKEGRAGFFKETRMEKDKMRGRQSCG